MHADELIGWELHGIAIEGVTSDGELARRWRDTVAPCSPRRSSADLTLRFDTEAGSLARAAPESTPRYRQGDGVEYHVSGSTAVARFPRFGTLDLDLARGRTHGTLVGTGWQESGVFEDLLAVALSPHLRRRGLYLLHAFGATLDGRAVLLVGGIGAGKTTTGLSLLEAGWKLLSNDSPPITAGGHVVGYPGLLSADARSYARFASTARLATGDHSGRKIQAQATDIWPDVWCDRARVGAIVFPSIGAGREHQVRELGAAEALRRLLPHAIEQWDRDMIPGHLAVLRELALSAPACELRLGSAVAGLPALLAGRLGAF